MRTVVAACGLALAVVVAVVSLVVRFRRSTPPERGRIKLLAAGPLLLVILFAVDGPAQSVGGSVYGVLAALVAVFALPAALATTLLRPEPVRL